MSCDRLFGHVLGANLAHGIVEVPLPAGAVVLGIVGRSQRGELAVMWAGRSRLTVPDVKEELRRIAFVECGSEMPDVGGWRFLGCADVGDDVVGAWLDPIVRPVVEKKEG